MIHHLLQKDKELFLYLNSLGSPDWDFLWLFITNKWAALPLYTMLLLLCFKVFKTKDVFLGLIVVALLITATDQTANLFKYGFERMRPCHDPEIEHLVRLVKPSCGGKFGYFSAHAANAFAVASFFTFLLKGHFKWLPWVLFIWGSAVAYSRVYVGVHFPLDIVTGAFIGLLFGCLFGFLYQKLVKIALKK